MTFPGRRPLLTLCAADCEDSPQAWLTENRIATQGSGFSPADLIRATEDAARRIVLAGADEISTQIYSRRLAAAAACN